VDNEDIYEFENFDISTGLITLRRIFDKNMILLNNRISTKSSNWKKMFFDGFCDEMMFLDKAIEHNLRSKMRTSQEHVMTLHY